MIDLSILHKIKADPVLVGWRGSIAHGMYIPPDLDMGTDDRDVMAVVIPPLRNYFGFDHFGSRGTQEIFEDHWDIVAYEFKKFVFLLEQGNPNVLSLLWLDQEFIIDETWEGKILREHREIFSGKHVYNAFVGYAHAQLQRMTRGESASGRGFMGEKRKEIRGRFGYDTKNAAHLIRLLRMGVEFLETGVLNVNREGIDSVELIAIKQGDMKLDWIMEESAALFEKSKKAFANSPLPEEPNRAWISDLCTTILKDHFLKNGGR